MGRKRIQTYFQLRPRTCPKGKQARDGSRGWQSVHTGGNLAGRGAGRDVTGGRGRQHKCWHSASKRRATNYEGYSVRVACVCWERLGRNCRRKSSACMQLLTDNTGIGVQLCVCTATGNSSRLVALHTNAACLAGAGWVDTSALELMPCTAWCCSQVRSLLTFDWNWHSASTCLLCRRSPPTIHYFLSVVHQCDQAVTACSQQGGGGNSGALQRLARGAARRAAHGEAGAGARADMT